MSIDINTNLNSIHQRIEQACQRCNRDPHRVELIAVSKKKPAELITQAAAAGQKVFGESYVQEFVDKQQQLSPDIRWHFIGALQSNKVKYLHANTELIHSVDRLSLAKEINKQWRKIDKVANILIQVNIANEATKAGVAPDKAETLIRTVAELPNVHIQGLMTLPPYNDNVEQVRPWFRQLRQLAKHINDLKLANVTMDTLSMGMSHDFEIAIEEGATLIRVGTAIFGMRE
ncbi:MAG: YggS family pyridoxal phosphate-dependent enzyme [Thermodesulfobacteriota bacterium]|nr:YggS family pyridoxal phosphate-dependent enzyme [Thermodesulfobacteriota bacterium]